MLIYHLIIIFGEVSRSFARFLIGLEFPYAKCFFPPCGNIYVRRNLPLILSLSRTFLSYQTETLYPLNSNSPLFGPPSIWGKPLYYFPSPWIWLLLVPHISGIIQYLSFCVWFISFSLMFSRFIHTVAHVKISFLFMAEYLICWVLITNTYHWERLFFLL